MGSSVCLASWEAVGEFVSRGREDPEARNVLLPLAAHLVHAPLQDEACLHRSLFVVSSQECSV